MYVSKFSIDFHAIDDIAHISNLENPTRSGRDEKKRMEGKGRGSVIVYLYEGLVCPYLAVPTACSTIQL